MKKQVIAALKLHGDGLKNLEDKTLLCENQMLKTIEEYKGKPFEPGHLIHTTLAHTMLILIFGQTSDKDVTAFIKDEHEMEHVLQQTGAYILLDIAPFLRHFVPPVKRAYTELINHAISSHSIYDKYIAARRNLYDHPNVESFIDHFFYLNIVNQNKHSTKKVDERDIRAMAHDMFGPGMITSAKTLEMMIALLVNHPNIQEALYTEINDVIGRREPKMEDKLSMPFTQAVILETFRYHSLLPLGLPHFAHCDSELQGFLVPAGTIVFPNLWALHHDDRYWESPWEFNPSRWLENGKVVPPDHIKRQRSLPFGTGRRQCPGEVFARNRLFVLITMMLQKFKFVPAEGHPRPNHDPSHCIVDITLIQKPYKLSVIPRY